MLLSAHGACVESDVPSAETIAVPPADTAPNVYVDADADGAPAGLDCDDAQPSVHPGAFEACNAADDDCDGAIDDGACPCVDDTDGAHAFLFCPGAASWDDAAAACAAWGYHLVDVEDATENDWIWGAARARDPEHPWWIGLHDQAAEGRFSWDGGSTAGFRGWREGEPNDQLGEDCAAFAVGGDGAWNDRACSLALPFVCEAGCVWRSWYADADGDGYGDPSDSTRACTAPAGTVADDGDCDDADPGVHPGGVEVCDAADRDEDCDGAIDDADRSARASSRVSWFPDADGDGFGDPDGVVFTCDAPSGWVADGGDCDDLDPNAAPGRAELPADGIDQDCDGADGCTWYLDADGDGHGDPDAPVDDCGHPPGYAPVGDDCDDRAPGTYPGAPDAWYDGVDADCAGDDDFDADRDGAAASRVGGADCDDGDPAEGPQALETCDGVDEDCDGTADEDACPVPAQTHGGHTYLFFAEARPWAEARAACAELGYHLVDLRDGGEDGWVWAGTGERATWTGLTDIATEGEFVWDGPAKSSYRHWRPAEPNDLAGAEDCVAWAADGLGSWNDKPCTEPLPYVCEAGWEPPLPAEDGAVSAGTR